MKIAIVGIRGVPARYGGLETCAEEVAVRLVQRGHEVVVYCRPGTWETGKSPYKGVRRITLPSLKTKFTDTYSHSLLAMLHLLKERPDVVLAFNPGIGTLCVIPKLFGYKVALNPDGFDWQRAKWGRFARAFIFASAWISAKVVDRIIADSVSIRDQYDTVFRARRPAVYIGNGADVHDSPLPDPIARTTLQKYGVEKGKYILFLSRHVPENSCDYLIRAFEGLDTDIKLLFGGAADGAYARTLRTTKDPRILFPGGIYDPEEVRSLHENCLLVLHGNQAGGMSLGLLKALGFGACVMTLSTPDNVAVTDGAAATYSLSVEEIRETMQRLIDDPDKIQAFRDRARHRISEEFTWDNVAQRYETVLAELSDSEHATAGENR